MFSYLGTKKQNRPQIDILFIYDTTYDSLHGATQQKTEIVVWALVNKDSFREFENLFGVEKSTGNYS